MEEDRAERAAKMKEDRYTRIYTQCVELVTDKLAVLRVQRTNLELLLSNTDIAIAECERALR